MPTVDRHRSTREVAAPGSEMTASSASLTSLYQKQDALWEAVAELRHEMRHHYQELRTQLECLATAVVSAGAETGQPGSASISSEHHYLKLVCRVRDIVCATVPRNATVLIASKGDAALLDLAGRTAWHFLQTRDGAYAGYHPASSLPAIVQLESARSYGAEFFVLPETGFWFLDHYPIPRFASTWNSAIPSSAVRNRVAASMTFERHQLEHRHRPTLGFNESWKSSASGISDFQRFSIGAWDTI